MTANSPLPNAGGQYVDRHFSEEAEPYWNGLRNEELLVQRCKACDRAFFPPRLVCPYCSSTNIDWFAASGGGEVYTYTILEWPPRGEWSDKTPYNNALIHLDEGAYLFSRVVDCPNEEIHIGMDVEIGFDHVTETVTLPVFRPVGE